MVTDAHAHSSGLPPVSWPLQVPSHGGCRAWAVPVPCWIGAGPAPFLVYGHLASSSSGALDSASGASGFRLILSSSEAEVGQTGLLGARGLQSRTWWPTVVLGPELQPGLPLGRRGTPGPDGLPQSSACPGLHCGAGRCCSEVCSCISSVLL